MIKTNSLYGQYAVTFNVRLTPDELEALRNAPLMLEKVMPENYTCTESEEQWKHLMRAMCAISFQAGGNPLMVNASKKD